MLDNIQNAQLHRLLSLTGLMDMKANLVMQYTGGRSSSSKDLTTLECNELIKMLKNEDEKLHGKSRRLILHYLRLLGYDYKHIEAFIKAIGSNNPSKKSLNNLGGIELNRVVSQVRAMYSKETVK